MQDRDGRRLDRKIDHFANRLPVGLAILCAGSAACRRASCTSPSPLALIASGFVGFLPVLSFWMIPIGLLLLAQDVPLIRLPLLSFVTWVERSVDAAKIPLAWL